MNLNELIKKEKEKMKDLREERKKKQQQQQQ